MRVIPILPRLMLTLACALLAPPVGLAQTYPVKPVRFVLPFTPGAGTDITARMLARKMQENLGQAFVVDNRPGAGGMLGAEIVAKARADGYTILFGTAALAVNAVLRAPAPFDPVRDLAPITLIAISPQFLLVHPNSRATTVRELVAMAREQPGKLNAGSTGTGSSSHLAIELFNQLAGIRITHIPYKGGSPSLAALLSGEIDLNFQGTIAALANLRAGRVRALAITSKTRSPAVPDIPTLDSFYPGYESANWFALFAPAGTPAPIVDKINLEVRNALKSPEAADVLAREGLDATGSTPAQLRAHLTREMERYARIIKAANVRPE